MDIQTTTITAILPILLMAIFMVILHTPLPTAILGILMANNR